MTAGRLFCPPFLFRGVRCTCPRTGQAEERLAGYGLRGPEVQESLEPARNQVAKEEAFWQQGDGLALFMAPNLLQYYRMSLKKP